jgi:hypothetical protein
MCIFYLIIWYNPLKNMPALYTVVFIYVLTIKHYVCIFFNLLYF